MATTATFLTHSITKIELLCNGQSIGSGTGFFFRHEKSWYLVTNWHVLSGCDPRTGQPRHRSGAIPDRCRFYFRTRTESEFQWNHAEYPLGDPFGGSANWFQHPIEGQAIDIAALPIAREHLGVAKDLMDPTGLDPDMFMDIGAEVFLPGYPLGVTVAGYMPLWKRASLACSLEFGEAITRKFFVDTASREGMSGAPCLAIANWKYYKLDRNTGKVEVVERPLSWRLLGVYSGRMNASDGFDAQLGIVWREILIPEVIAAGKPGSVVLISSKSS